MALFFNGVPSWRIPVRPRTSAESDGDAPLAPRTPGRTDNQEFFWRFRRIAAPSRSAAILIVAPKTSLPAGPPPLRGFSGRHPHPTLPIVFGWKGRSPCQPSDDPVGSHRKRCRPEIADRSAGGIAGHDRKTYGTRKRGTRSLFQRKGSCPPFPDRVPEIPPFTRKQKGSGDNDVSRQFRDDAGTLTGAGGNDILTIPIDILR